MITILWHTLRESYNRRMGLVLLIISVAFAVGFVWFPRIVRQPDGSVVVYVSDKLQGAADAFARSLYGTLLQTGATLLIMLAVFAVAPLLTTHMEKGWVDLLLSKGVPRWQVFLGRWLGALLLFIASLAVMNGIPALYFWVRAGVKPGWLPAATGFVVLSFASLLAVMALVSMAHSSQAVPIIFAILYVSLAPVLQLREHMLYDTIKAKWAHWLIDWAYRILPKTGELTQAARTYLNTGTVKAWWPAWSSGLFIVGALAMTAWIFRRKSF